MQHISNYGGCPLDYRHVPYIFRKVFLQATFALQIVCLYHVYMYTIYIVSKFIELL